MSEDKWKVIKIKFEQTLKYWELDKKTNQFTTDSICSLFPTEIEAIIKYIEDLENNWNELKKYIENELGSKYIHKYDVLEKMQELENRKV